MTRRGRESSLRDLEARLRELRDEAPPPSLAARLERSVLRPEASLTGRAPLRLVPRLALWTVIGVALVAAGILAPRLGVRRASLLGTLDSVVYATGNTGAVHVVLNSRTREGEDFSFVEISGALQRTEVWIENPEQKPDNRLRMEKSDRVYVFDGHVTTRYFRRGNEILRLQGRRLGTQPLWPADWLRQVPSRPGAEVLDQEESGDRVRLLLLEKAVSSAPLPPVFLREFDRETEFVWERETQRLLSMRRWVRHAGARVLVSETESIQYLPVIDDALFRVELAPGARLVALAPPSSELAALGPRQVARALFDAAARADRTTLEMLCAFPSVVDSVLQEPPAEVLEIGEPIRTASYPGVLVPYQVRLRNGRVFSHRLAVRNDNAQNRWEYDGGLW
jgi:hypothetical protein